MPRSVAPWFRGLLIAALVTLPLALIGACSSESGVTPTCANDVGEAGIQPGVDGGCTGFAVCAGHESDPAFCCKTADGKKFTGDQLSLCLFAYGEGTAPTTAAATSSSSSSSSGTGSGGAGGSK
jgi:hypothetical protein